MGCVHVDAACDEGCAAAEGKRNRVDGVVDGALGRRLGQHPQLGGGRVLALREPVDPVVEEQDLQVEITPNAVE